MQPYWQIQCPHCLGITYYRVVNSPSEEWLIKYRRWPVLKCRCGKYFSKMESELYIYTCCEPIDNPSDLQKRQAIPIELEVRE